MRKVILAAVLLLSSCSEYVVETYPEWCEQISGVDLKKKLAPAWALNFTLKFNGEAIRDDFVKFLDDSYMAKVERRPPQMAWREGTQLHLVNLSSFFTVDPNVMIDGWRQGIEAAKQQSGSAVQCPYGTAITLFDGLYIHSMENDGTESQWKDQVTAISTDRRQRYGSNLL